MPVNVVDFESGNGFEEYRIKALKNTQIFDSLKRVFSIRENLGFEFENPREKTKSLLDKIEKITKIERKKIDIINVGDELLQYANFTSIFENFGCTSIGKEGIIGQTMDLFTFELSVVKEGGSVYVTWPPYLTLLGMNKNIAMCTNYLNGKVEKGTPVSNIRRDLLRCESIDEIFLYFRNIKRTTNANFLISNGERVYDFELTPENIEVHGIKKSRSGSYIAHTNHILEDDIERDKKCNRLTKAVKLLKEGRDLKEILDDREINVPIQYQGPIGFGSIVKVIMDVKNKTFSYKDPSMREYSEIIV